MATEAKTRVDTARVQVKHIMRHVTAKDALEVVQNADSDGVVIAMGLDSAYCLSAKVNGKFEWVASCPTPQAALIECFRYLVNHRTDDGKASA